MRINKLVSKLSIGMLCATGVTLAANPAHALSFRSCSGDGYDISGKVSGATGCTISDHEDNDSVSPNQPLTVNGDPDVEKGGFFGFDNWKFGGKIGEDSGYNGDGSGKVNGSEWNLSQVIEDSWDDVMLVFKSGNKTTLVGYMLEDGVDSGTWDSPYDPEAFKDAFKNTKDVSHISVYYRPKEDDNPPKRVPEPTSILGLVAVSAFVGSSLKRKRESSNLELS